MFVQCRGDHTYRVNGRINDKEVPRHVRSANIAILIDARQYPSLLELPLYPYSPPPPTTFVGLYTREWIKSLTLIISSEDDSGSSPDRNTAEHFIEF